MKSPTVSVIIPVYNCPEFIKNTLESVFNQTYSDYEIIVINDGSTDNTHEVLQQYIDKIKYFHQENQGVGVARNYGLKIAEGELIAFLDQDDIFLPDKLAKQVNIFNSEPNIHILHSAWELIDAQGKKLDNIQLPWQKINIDQLDLEGWLQWKPVLLSAMMFRKSCLEKAGNFDPRFAQACDVDLMLRMLLAGYQVKWQPTVTTLYRQHNHNTSSNTLVQAKESDLVLDKFFNYPNIPANIKSNEKTYRYHTLVWGAWRLYCTGHISEMIEKLRLSLNYSPYSKIKTMYDWISNMVNYSKESCINFDVLSLEENLEWQELIKEIINF